ncbi:MAG TPA: hypothetical protein VFJ77_05625 [Gaiellaceae bacterium]|nr:hypothetical protein [Gaiellaceae bacterium]
MRRLALLPLAAAAILAGCGSGSREAQSCEQKAEAKALARLNADVKALHAAALRAPGSSLAGTPKVSRLTDRFLNDVNTAPIDNLARNRLIDHAAAALAGTCQQCFQALEASRPIPAIAHTGRGGCEK